MSKTYGRFNGVYIDLSHPVVCAPTESYDDYYVMPHRDKIYGEHSGGFIDKDSYDCPVIVGEFGFAFAQLNLALRNFAGTLVKETKICALLTYTESLIRKVQRFISNLKNRLTNI